MTTQTQMVTKTEKTLQEVVDKAWKVINKPEAKRTYPQKYVFLAELEEALTNNGCSPELIENPNLPGVENYSDSQGLLALGMLRRINDPFEPQDCDFSYREGKVKFFVESPQRRKANASLLDKLLVNHLYVGKAYPESLSTEKNVVKKILEIAHFLNQANHRKTASEREAFAFWGARYMQWRDMFDSQEEFEYSDIYQELTAELKLLKREVFHLPEPKVLQKAIQLNAEKQKQAQK